MINSILEVLEEEGIKTYLCREEVLETVELFFVKKEQDMRRHKHVCKYALTIYMDFEQDGVKKRGACTTQIFLGMTKQEIAAKVKETAYSASFAANAYYELPKGRKEDRTVMPGRIQEVSLNDAADAMVAALYKNDGLADAFLNSAEFFVEKQKVRILNSEGIDVSYLAHSLKGEFIVQCLSPKDVEYYEKFEYDDIAADDLEELVKNACQIVKARAEAEKAPDTGTYDVILSGRHVGALLGFFEDRTNASCIYPGYTNYKVGDSVQGGEIAGEKVNIVLKASYPYSTEGIKMEDLQLVEDGILKAIQGDARYSYYLGIPPTGWYNKITAQNGTVGFADMKQGKCLHVVSFSDFNVDAFTGSFGGEIRLAYLYEDGVVTYVTGGSISGSMFEAQKDMVFSVEQYKDSGYAGPLAVKVKKIAVAGA